MNFLTCNVAAIRTESGLRARIDHNHLRAERILKGPDRMGLDGWNERQQLFQEAEECAERLRNGDFDEWAERHPPERIVRLSGPGFAGRVS